MRILKKLPNINFIYLLPTFLGFVFLLFLLLQTLYIKNAPLFDIGYWIGLSTNFNPLLIEPNVINSESYFYTHFSPFFIFLQIIYTILPFKNPPLYFTFWYSLLTIIPFIISIYYVFVRKNQITEKVELSTLFFKSFLIGSLLFSYFAQFPEIFTFPHTEFIGIEYIGAGWLILSIVDSNELNNIYGNKKLSKNLGFFLIVFGSSFHELIGVFGIISLLTLNLNKLENIIFLSKTKEWLVIKIRYLFNLKNSYFQTMLLISFSLFLWIIFTKIIFHTNQESALNRIYLGSGNDFLNHINLGYYFRNFFELIKSNIISFFYLALSYFLLIIGNVSKLKNLFLPSLLLLIYVLISPLAIHGPAAVLSTHYSYPLVLTFFFLLYALFVIDQNSKFENIIKKRFFKPIIIFIIIVSFQFIRIYIPFEIEVLTEDFKERNRSEFILSSSDKKDHKLFIESENLIPNFLKIPKNIIDLINISNNSNKVFQDYFRNKTNYKNNYKYNLLERNNNLYLSSILNPKINKPLKMKNYNYKGLITYKNKKSAILFEESGKDLINLPINSLVKNYHFGEFPDKKQNKNTFSIDNFKKVIKKNIDNEFLRRYKLNLDKNDLLFLVSEDFNSDGLNEIYWREKNGNMFLKMTLNSNGEVSELSYQSQEQMIQYFMNNGLYQLSNELISYLTSSKNKSVIFNNNNSDNINIDLENIEISKNYIQPIIRKEYSKNIDNESLKRFEKNLEKDNLLLLFSGDFNNDGLTEIYWKDRNDIVFLRMTINDNGNVLNLSYQSEEQMIQYLTKNGFDYLTKNLISFLGNPSYNQILDGETATLYPNISKRNLLIPYLHNENIKLSQRSFIYWTLAPEKKRDFDYIKKVLNESELKKIEYIKLGNYSGMPYYLRKYYYN